MNSGTFHSVHNCYLWNDRVCYGSQPELRGRPASEGLAHKPNLLCWEAWLSKPHLTSPGGLWAFLREYRLISKRSNQCLGETLNPSWEERKANSPRMAFNGNSPAKLGFLESEEAAVTCFSVPPLFTCELRHGGAGKGRTLQHFPDRSLWALDTLTLGSLFAPTRGYPQGERDEEGSSPYSLYTPSPPSVLFMFPSLPLEVEITRV